MHNESAYNPLAITDSTLENMAYLLSIETRLKVFEELCRTFAKRVPEHVWLETGIRKTDVYRYLPKSESKRGGLVPSPATTVKIIKALLKIGRYEFVAKALEPAGDEMRKSYHEYFSWVKFLKAHDFIYNPLSNIEIRKLERSLY